MSALADMLARHSDGEDGKGAADGAPPPDESRKMGVESLKACFEAAKSGDYETAYDHLAAAIEHCEDTEYGPEPEGMGGDEPHGGHGGLAIVIPHKG